MHSSAPSICVIKSKATFKILRLSNHKFKSALFLIKRSNQLKYSSSEKNLNSKSFNIGFAISRKFGKACKRNLIRRRIKSILLDIANNLNPNLKNACDYFYLFIPFPEALNVEFHILLKELNFALRKLMNNQ